MRWVTSWPRPKRSRHRRQPPGDAPTGVLGGEPALNAAWAFRNGGPEQEALKMVTLNAAEVIGMGDRIGSVDVGRTPTSWSWKDSELVSKRQGNEGLRETTSGSSGY